MKNLTLYVWLFFQLYLDTLLVTPCDHACLVRIFYYIYINHPILVVFLFTHIPSQRQADFPCSQIRSLQRRRIHILFKLLPHSRSKYKLVIRNVTSGLWKFSICIPQACKRSYESLAKQKKKKKN